MDHNIQGSVVEPVGRIQSDSIDLFLGKPLLNALLGSIERLFCYGVEK